MDDDGIIILLVVVALYAVGHFALSAISFLFGMAKRLWQWHHEALTGERRPRYNDDPPGD